MSLKTVARICLTMGFLLIVAGVLVSCGVFDFTGANARAQAQAELAAANARVYEAQVYAQEAIQVAQAHETGETERARAYYSHQETLIAMGRGAESPISGITFGMTWPVILIGAAAMFLVLAFLVGRRETLR